MAGLLNYQRNFECLVQQLFLKFEFTKDLSAQIRGELATLAAYAHNPASKVIFRQSDPPEAFYILLHGEMQVWQIEHPGFPAPAEPTLIGGEDEALQYCRAMHLWLAQASADQRLDFLGRRVGSTLPSLPCTPPFGTRPTSREKFRQKASTKAARVELDSLGRHDLAHVATLGPGLIFGDVGLLENLPRNATVRCAVDTDILVIRKTDIERLLKEELIRMRFKEHTGPMWQLLKDYKYFRDLEPDIQAKVPEMLSHMYKRKGSMLFNQGDDPELMYVILQGEVKLWRSDAPGGGTPTPPQVPKAKEGKLWRPDVPGNRSPSPPQVPKAKEVKKNSKIKSSAILGRLATIAAQDPQFAPEFTVGGRLLATSGPVEKSGAKLAASGAQLLATLSPGTMFGDQPLLDDRPRGMAATCSEDCHFLVVRKSEVETLVKEKIRHTQLGLQLLVEPLIQRVPFFQNLEHHVQQNVPQMMKYRYEPKGAILFWEGDPPPGSCYLILSGSVALCRKNLGSETVLIGSRPSTADGEIREHCMRVAACLEHARVVTPVTASSMSSGTDGPVPRKRPSRLSSNLSVGSVNMEQRAHEAYGSRVAILGAGMVVGEEALFGEECHKSTALCSEGCDLLVISRADYDTTIQQACIKAKLKQIKPALRRLLKEFSLFKELSPALQEAVPDIVKYHTEPQGRVLFEEGDAPSAGAFIVLSGEVTVWLEKLGAPPPPPEPAKSSATGSEVEEGSEGSSPQGNAQQGIAERVRRTLRGGPPRPFLVPVAPAIQDKCASVVASISEVSGVGNAVTHMLSSDEEDEHPDSPEHGGKEPAEVLDVRNILTDSIGGPVVSLGPGSLVGEMALLNDNTRNATITCAKDCEFLKIEKADFDTILKAEMKKAKEEKLQFLKEFVPGVKQLKHDVAERLLYYFNKVQVSRHHAFIEQGETFDGSIFLCWQGCVEISSKADVREKCGFEYGLPNQGVRRLGIVLRGGIFAATPLNESAPFSCIATTTPCEVLLVKPADRRHVPDFVMHQLQELLDQAAQRRMALLEPLGSPGAGPSGGLSPFASTWSSSGASSSTFTVTVTRPSTRSGPVGSSSRLMTPMQTKAAKQRHTKTQTVNIMRTTSSVGGGKLVLRKQQGPFAGLWERESHEVDYLEFDMEPGEVLALTARKPRRRERALRISGAASLNASTSLPSLR